MRRIEQLGICITFLFFGSFWVKAQKSQVEGAYMSCEMACQAIQIRHDGTFQRLLDGDLYNDERTDGNWKSLGPNRIKAWSKKPSEPKIREISENRSDFKFVVLDYAGAVEPGVAISMTVDGKQLACVTMDDGSVDCR